MVWHAVQAFWAETSAPASIGSSGRVSVDPVFGVGAPIAFALNSTNASSAAAGIGGEVPSGVGVVLLSVPLLHATTNSVMVSSARSLKGVVIRLELPSKTVLVNSFTYRSSLPQSGQWTG